MLPRLNSSPLFSTFASSRVLNSYYFRIFEVIFSFSLPLTMIFFHVLVASLFFVARSVFGYTAEEREAVLVEMVDGPGFPRLEAWNKMPPKMLKSVLSMYFTAMGEDAFEFFDAKDIEIIFAAASAVNNCELCLSFHSMAMAGNEADAEDIKEIVAGGLPKDPAMRKLVIASKYALAHKGIFLPREKLHLASMGIDGEQLVELNFLVGLMSAMNMNYIHLISNGLELEPMLQQVGPFADTVYAKGDGEL